VLERFSVWVEGLDHPEGVAVSSAGAIFAGGEAGQIYAVSSDCDFSEVANTGGSILGLALDAEDRVYACDVGNRALVRWDPADGELRTLCSEVQGQALKAPNYPTFGPDGILYFTDSGRRQEENGMIYALDRDGEERIFTRESRCFPNGCALSPDGAYLYVVESFFPAVVRFGILPDGSAGPREIVAQLPDSVPDGICFGESGNLYVSCYRPDRIYTITPERRITILAEDPIGGLLNAPTNLAFAGPRRDRLVVASLGGRKLSIASVGDVGIKLSYPNVSY
jgi:gluconolactonase